jgi:hypothetical protein
MSDSRDWSQIVDADDDEETSGGDASKNFKDLRKFARERDREAKKLAEEVEQLREFQKSVTAERKSQALTGAFTELDLNPAHAKLFEALNPDITPEDISKETVAKFAVEYGLATTQAGGEVEATEEVVGFKPVTTGNSLPGKEYTSEEINTLLREGKFSEVDAAVKAGKVKKDPVPWTTL